MNVAFLMLTSAVFAGADPAPATAAPAAPAVAATGSCCGGTGSSCGDCGDPCCGRQRKKLRDLFHRDHCCCEAPAPAPCCKPACPPPCPPKPVCCKPVCPPPCPPAPCCKPAPVCCKPAPVCQPAPVCCKPAPVCAPAPACEDSCCGKKGLGARLRGLFHKRGCCEDNAGCGGCGAAAPAPAPVPGGDKKPEKMPTTIGSTGTIVVPGNIGIVEGAKNPFDLRRRYEGRANHADDYSTLTGQLFFVHTDGGRWVLRYAPISQEDRFGGSVILTRDARLGPCQEGDLVTVRGEILAEKNDIHLGGAVYRASVLELVEKGE